ncbi:MAG: NfeD family protein [Actinomycetota bacterium]
MSRVVVRFLAAVGAVAIFLGVLVTPATAQDGELDPAVEAAGFVEIFEVSGLLDDVLAAAIEDAVRGVNSDGARGLVLQVNSKQAVVSDERLNELAALIAESPVPVSVWVGPSGSRAAGKVAQLVGVADSVGVAIGARLGDTGEQALDTGRFGEVWGDNQALLEDTDLTWEQAIDVGIVACDLVDVDELGNPLTPEQSLARCANPTIGDFLVAQEFFDSRVDSSGDEPRLEPLTRVRFRGLSLLDQLMHTVASPPVAYLLLVIGLGLLVFEFYSIGIGIAGVIGAVFLALGGYGVAALPFRTWALVLIVLAFVAFSIDVQTAVPRAWTAIGMVLFVIGTLFFYPESDVAMSWIPMTVAILGIGVVMYRGMPIMVRGRFATTAIPRDFLIDEVGTVVDAGDGDDPATVQVRDSHWRGRSEATLAADDEVVVTGVDGLVLEVAPRE